MCAGLLLKMQFGENQWVDKTMVTMVQLKLRKELIKHGYIYIKFFLCVSWVQLYK